MKNIQPAFSLDGVLLFSLTLSFIMKYRISPGDTPYWLFTLIFILLLSYFFVNSSKMKTILVWLAIIMTIGSALLSSVIVRYQTAPEFGVHDIILQLESAIRYMLQGINPYAADYFGTPLEKWHYSDTDVNPALYHFVMPPFYLLFSIPFYFLGTSLFGLVDGRLPLIFCFVGILFVLSKWVEQKQRPTALLLFAFNPATIDYFIEGRSDFFMHFFLVASLWFLYQRRALWSAVLLALAFAVKQSIWPFFPLYFLYMYSTHRKQFFSSLGVFSSVFIGIILPFILWDTHAFIGSTVLYLSGGGENSYPISGYGFGMLLYQMGIIREVSAYFPFTVFQVLGTLPVLYIAGIYIVKKPTVRNLLFSYAFVLFVFWYFSRYFNNSHIGYISSILVTAYFLPEQDNEKK
jgi:hypothetical protein